MSEKKNSYVKIISTRFNPDGVTLQTREVHAQGNNLKECEKIARDIWRSELK